MRYAPTQALECFNPLFLVNICLLLQESLRNIVARKTPHPIDQFLFDSYIRGAAAHYVNIGAGPQLELGGTITMILGGRG